MPESGAPLTIHDVVAKLEPLKTVDLEHIDSEGVALNNPDVYHGLSQEDQLSVDEAYSEATEYLKQNPRRSETELSNHGYPTGLATHPQDGFEYFATIAIPGEDEDRRLQLRFPK